MKLIFKKAVLRTAFAVCILSITLPAVHSADPVSSTSLEDTARAVTRLTELGVPLQKDPSGDVRWIEAKQGELTDKAMSLLPLLPKLEWLEIGNGIVTGEGMKSLGKCTLLKRLYVHDINLENEKLEWLKNLTRLEALSLQRTKIDGRVLKNLNAVGTLKVLNLSETGIMDDDLAQIARFNNLEVLALAETKITGAGLRKLEGMARLNELNITNCAVYDSDLNSFLTMPNLRIVYAEGCNISQWAIGSVISQFPTLAIFQ